jgi:manganese/iron transport system permease protein
MNEILQFFMDPWQYEFMRRACIVSMMAGAVCGVVGTFVVLRGMAFISDAVAHSVFPGVALGYVLHGNLAVSGAAAGIATALAIAVVSQNRRLKEDAVIGVLFALAFGLGIVIVSTQTSYTGDLASFLFGHLLGISNEDVVIVAIVGVSVLALIFLLRKELVTVALDRETALASGLPVFQLDALLYVLVTLAVVISLQAVGNILVLALIVTPAATARLLADRLLTMMALAAAIGAFACLAGLYLSYTINLATGGLIVVIISGIFFSCWLFAPRHGLLARTAFAEPVSSAERTASAPSPGSVVG